MFGTALGGDGSLTELEASVDSDSFTVFTFSHSPHIIGQFSLASGYLSHLFTNSCFTQLQSASEIKIIPLSSLLTSNVDSTSKHIDSVKLMKAATKFSVVARIITKNEINGI